MPKSGVEFLLGSGRDGDMSAIEMLRDLQIVEGIDDSLLL